MTPEALDALPADSQVVIRDADGWLWVRLSSLPWPEAPTNGAWQSRSECVASAADIPAPFTVLAPVDGMLAACDGDPARLADAMGGTWGAVLPPIEAIAVLRALAEAVT